MSEMCWQMSRAKFFVFIGFELPNVQNVYRWPTEWPSVLVISLLVETQYSSHTTIYFDSQIVEMSVCSWLAPRPGGMVEGWGNQ